MRLQARAKELLAAWRGDNYSFGPDCLEDAGVHAAALGGPVLVVANDGRWLRPYRERVMLALSASGCASASSSPVPGAGPNAPEADVLRLAGVIRDTDAPTVLVMGGGSTIDAVKAALAVEALGGDPDVLAELFGTNEVSTRLHSAGKRLRHLVAVQTAASSAAHLTKYSNVTLGGAWQKKLIVDTALVPGRAVFDYDVTMSSPASLTADGAFDGMAHCLEVWWGTAHPATDPTLAAAIAQVSLCGLELLVKYLPAALGTPDHPEARVALGLGTDLGGYSIMLGGTNGPHLNSFSMVEVAPHGRACAILNPYWTVFFAPAMESQLRAVAEIYGRYGYLEGDVEGLPAGELGISVARGMLRFASAVGYPTTLAELPGFEERHLQQALAAARDPQLSMKLRNMPIPLDPESVGRYMEPILRAAVSGDLGLVRKYQG